MNRAHELAQTVRKTPLLPMDEALVAPAELERLAAAAERLRDALELIAAADRNTAAWMQKTARDALEAAE